MGVTTNGKNTDLHIFVQSFEVIAKSCIVIWSDTSSSVTSHCTQSLTAQSTFVLTFLGIVIDTIRGELRLSAYKLHLTMVMVSSWMQKKSCTRRELESLIGTLQHACKVITAGRSFLRRVIALLSPNDITTFGSMQCCAQIWRGGTYLHSTGMV